LRALIFKELASAWPYFATVVVLFVTDIFALAFVDPFEVAPAERLEVDALGWLAVAGALVFWSAHSSIDHEVRGEHLELLDGLPTSREVIFAAKSVATGLLVATVAAAFVGREIIWWSTVAVDGGPSISSSAAWLMPRFVLALAALGSLGLFTGWLGSTGFALAIIALFAVEFLAAVSPGWQHFALSSLVVPTFDGSVPVPSPESPARWAVASLATGFASFAVMRGRGEAWLAAAASRVRRLAPAAGLLGLGLVVMSAGLMTLLQQDDLADLWIRAPVRTRLPGFEVYFASGPDDDDEDVPRARDLLRRIPEIERGVARFFGDASLPRLDLEITPWSGAHAGRYSGGKIRVDASPSAEATIAHELAHAHAFHAAGRVDVPDSLFATKFFHEGLADWVEAQVVPERSGAARNRALAASLFRAEEHHLAGLLDGRERMKERATEELYALGQAFVQALVETRGSGVLACLTRAERESPFTRSCGPLLWADLAARCRIDLEAISRRYEVILETWASQVPDVRADIRVNVVASERATRLEVLDVRNQSLDLSCRVRMLEDTSDALIVGSRVYSGMCRVPQDPLAGDEFWYQIGHALPTETLVPDDADRNVMRYGPWIRAEVPEDPSCGDLDCVREHSPPWPDPSPWSLAPLETEPHIDGLADGAVTHDDRYVVLGFRDGVIEVRTGSDGLVVGRWSEPYAELETVELSPDESRLLVRYEDRWTMWSMPDGRRLWRTSRAFASATFLPGHRSLLAMDGAGALHARDVETGQVVAHLASTGIERIHDLAGSRDTGHFVASTGNETLELISPNFVRRRTLQPEPARVIHLSNVRDGRAVYVKNREQVAVFDVVTGDEVIRVGARRHGALIDGGHLVVTSHDEELTVVSIEHQTRETHREVDADHVVPGRRAAFATNETITWSWWRYDLDRRAVEPWSERETTHLAVRVGVGPQLGVRSDRVLHLVSPDDCTTRLEVEDVPPSGAFDFSPNGRHVVASYEHVERMDLATGDREVLASDVDRVRSIEWAVDDTIALMTRDDVLLLRPSDRQLDVVGHPPTTPKHLVHRTDRGDVCALTWGGVRCFDLETGVRTLDQPETSAYGWLPATDHFLELHGGGRLVDESGAEFRLPPHPNQTLDWIGGLDERRVALETSDHRVVGFDAVTGRWDLDTRIHDEAIRGIERIPGTGRIASWTITGEVAIWDAETGDVICRRTFR
jgi:WD40 repeat protein